MNEARPFCPLSTGLNPGRKLQDSIARGAQLGWESGSEVIDWKQ